MKSIKSFIAYSFVETFSSNSYKGLNLALPFTTLSCYGGAAPITPPSGILIEAALAG